MVPVGGLHEQGDAAGRIGEGPPDHHGDIPFAQRDHRRERARHPGRGHPRDRRGDQRAAPRTAQGPWPRPRAELRGPAPAASRQFWLRVDGRLRVDRRLRVISERRARVTSGDVRITDITVVLHERAAPDRLVRTRRPAPARRAADPDRRGHRGQRLPRPTRAPARRRSPSRSSPSSSRGWSARTRSTSAGTGGGWRASSTTCQPHAVGTRRRRAVGHRGQGRRPARPPAARHLPGPHPRLLLHRAPPDRGGVRRGGRLLAGAGLEGLQAAPAARPVAAAGAVAAGRLRHRGLRGGPGRGRRRA